MQFGTSQPAHPHPYCDVHRKFANADVRTGGFVWDQDSPPISVAAELQGLQGNGRTWKLLSIALRSMELLAQAPLARAVGGPSITGSRGRRRIDGQ